MPGRSEVPGSLVRMPLAEQGKGAAKSLLQGHGEVMHHWHERRVHLRALLEEHFRSGPQACDWNGFITTIHGQVVRANRILRLKRHCSVDVSYRKDPGVF